MLWISCFLSHKGLLGVTKQSGSGMLFTVWQQIFENCLIYFCSILIVFQYYFLIKLDNLLFN